MKHDRESKTGERQHHVSDVDRDGTRLYLSIRHIRKSMRSPTGLSFFAPM